MPVVTLCVLAISPAAEPFVQVESTVPIHIATIAHLEVTQPIAHDINESSDGSTQHTGSDQDEPYLTRVRNLLHMTQDPRCARIEVAQTLTLFGILEDPVYGGEVVVAHAATRALDVPVQPRGILCILGCGRGRGGRIEVVQDELGRVARGVIGAQVLGPGCGRSRQRRGAVFGAEGGGEEAWEAEGGRGRGFLRALEGKSTEISMSIPRAASSIAVLFRQCVSQWILI